MTLGTFTPPARAESTAEHIADLLRENIYRGVHAPDAPLREVSLAESFSVSRRTVREALLILDRQGLVRHEHNRGARVRVMTSADVIDLYRVRRTLEVQGVRASPSAAAATRARLTAAFNELVRQAQLADSQQIIKSDLAFHAAVVALNDSPRIDTFFEQIGHEMRMAIAMLREDETQLGEADVDVVAEHGAIYERLLRGDVVEAQLAVLHHIDFNERRLLRLVER